MTIVVTPNAPPTFNNLTTQYCQGAAIPPLPQLSSNGVLGTWFPPVNNQQTTTYTFVPGPGQCSNQAQVQIVITPITTPTFTQVPAICAGGFLAPLPT